MWYHLRVEMPRAATEKDRLLARAYGPMMVSLPDAPMPKGRKSPNRASASVTRHLVQSGRGPHRGPCAAESAEDPHIVLGCRAFLSVGRVVNALSSLDKW